MFRYICVDNTTGCVIRMLGTIMTKQIFKLFLFLISFSVLCGCEGINEFNGTVVDEQGKGLSNVLIKYECKHNTFYSHIDTITTNSIGNFTNGELVMCFPNCPDLKITYSKSGYLNKIVEYNDEVINGQKTIQMKIK